MKSDRIFSTQERVKLGNTIIYLAENCPNLYKTKLLKLLYLIEEASVKKYARPFLNLDFYVWQMGPISRELFVELSSEKPNLLEEFIILERSESGLGETTLIKPKQRFDDSEFSDSDLLLLQTIVRDFGEKSGKELIGITHTPHSLWYKFAESNGLLSEFALKKTNLSDVRIKLDALYEQDEEKRKRYLHALELYESAQSLA